MECPHNSQKQTCVCVCVFLYAWFMRTQMCIMTWVLHWYYDVNMKYEDIS